MLQDAFMPSFDVAKTESILIKASAAQVWPLVEQLDFSESRVIWWLFKLRGIPVPESMTLAGLQNMGFEQLTSTPGQELILGLVGQFWSLSGKLQRFSAEEFADYARPGFAKTSWSFQIIPTAPNECRLETETRVLCFGEREKRQFRRYRWFVQPFSSWTRREMLRSIKRKAEQKT